MNHKEKKQNIFDDKLQKDGYQVVRNFLYSQVNYQ